PALLERIEKYHQWGVRVSLFMDPDLEQIKHAKEHGADRVELYTGPFAQTVWDKGLDHPDSQASFTLYKQAAQYAVQLGLGVNAGHDLDLVNLPLFCLIEEIAEVSIGHALIADALDRGLYETVIAYLKILSPD
ncbi:MAG: pyridoxine 5'-phosphate synthase, partial [Gammaproteobacteria bacterium]|nr:pyridoxine 5'-phosphate synthase [Gammaproteobacteria bacterium]